DSPDHRFSFVRGFRIKGPHFVQQARISCKKRVAREFIVASPPGFGNPPPKLKRAARPKESHHDSGIVRLSSSDQDQRSGGTAWRAWRGSAGDRRRPQPDSDDEAETGNTRAPYRSSGYRRAQGYQ